jgi:putative ABC transport system permease protein
MSFIPDAAALAVLLAVAVGVAAAARLGHSAAMARAAGRAVVQLLAVGLVLGLVFRAPGLAPVYLLVMLAAATATSARRLRGAAGAWPAAALAITAGAATASVVVFSCQALPFTARTLVPFVAQLIGGSMTATTLAGQRLLDDVRAGWEQVEGWLALGATSARAVAEPARVAAGRALVPALDQTRNVGLVVLPGAYVGLLLGGATPLEAGRTQLLVLIGLLAAETVAAVTVTRLLARRLARQQPTSPA